ncbi:hypothetical protein BB561_001422 [Smittium simulii]|uniref:RING-type domain-containing protein n=1 Tax=Smittium simulii TaxID=133385 RepID=A0A2T9YUN6_9FUNG|nr:hypothetical protein BB561_001422 [Smittium simulii]
MKFSDSPAVSSAVEYEPRPPPRQTSNYLSKEQLSRLPIFIVGKNDLHADAFRKRNANKSYNNVTNINPNNTKKPPKDLNATGSYLNTNKNITPINDMFIIDFDNCDNTINEKDMCFDLKIPVKNLSVPPNKNILIRKSKSLLNFEESSRSQCPKLLRKLHSKRLRSEANIQKWLGIKSPSADIPKNEAGKGKNIIEMTIKERAKSESNILMSDNSLQLNVCAICLDDIDIGSRVRLLPCGHLYHVECIDAWLLKRSTTCPYCKFDILNNVNNKKVVNETSQNENTNNQSSPTNTSTTSSSEMGFASRRCILYSKKVWAFIKKITIQSTEIISKAFFTRRLI